MDFIWLAFISLLLAGSSPSNAAQGIDITLKWISSDPEDWGDWQFQCSNIPPGECCRPHHEVLSSLGAIGSSVTTFSHLLANQLGAGWGAVDRSFQSSCEGTPIVRLFGPTGPFPSAVYRPPITSLDIPDGEPDEIVFSASWIDLRTRLPPDPAGTRYLQFQGVKGLIWGKNTWSAASGGIPFPKRTTTQRLNSWASHGTAYLSAPPRWRHPSVYIMNGTTYTKSGGERYESRDGKTLNLTMLTA